MEMPYYDVDIVRCVQPPVAMDYLKLIMAFKTRV